jgi:alkanesulfonate monooxygenase SsuD/methylene tetrahydromethanopterin reductase-like flavin-dependent oxidoreductase (luciferase family)
VIRRGVRRAGVPEFGIYVPQVGRSFEQLLERARWCEELGFDSFWIMDHLYGPGLPNVPSFESWTLATALLALTDRLRVGQLVLSATFRHPALLAKMVTTLDVISQGRLELALGSGSYEEEHRRAGIPWGTLAERTEILDETLQILVTAFEEERVSVTGRRFQLHDFPVLPRPVQRPRPRLHIGGSGERRTLPLVARYADVWNCPTYAAGQVMEKRAALDRACEQAGRDPASIATSLEAVLVLAGDEPGLAEATALAERRYGGAGFGLHEGGFIGTPAVIRHRIGELVERGVSQFVFFTHDRGDRPTLERFAAEVMPAFR